DVAPLQHRAGRAVDDHREAQEVAARLPGRGAGRPELVALYEVGADTEVAVVDAAHDGARLRHRHDLTDERGAVLGVADHDGEALHDPEVAALRDLEGAREVARALRD